jgi:hypothetical protein
MKTTKPFAAFVLLCAFTPILALACNKKDEQVAPPPVATVTATAAPVAAPTPVPTVATAAPLVAPIAVPAQRPLGVKSDAAAGAAAKDGAAPPAKGAATAAVPAMPAMPDMAALPGIASNIVAGIAAAIPTAATARDK